MNSCKTALSNLISSERILESNDPYSAFSSANLNFHKHYCEDNHTSEWLPPRQGGAICIIIM